ASCGLGPCAKAILNLAELDLEQTNLVAEIVEPTAEIVEFVLERQRPRIVRRHRHEEEMLGGLFCFQRGPFLFLPSNFFVNLRGSPCVVSVHRVSPCLAMSARLSRACSHRALLVSRLMQRVRAFMLIGVEKSRAILLVHKNAAEPYKLCLMGGLP